MKNIVRVLVLTLLCGWSARVWADCPSGQILKKIGNVLTDDGVVSAQGQDIHAISVDCGGSACLAGLVNEDTLAAFNADGDVSWEGGAAANGVLFLDLTDNPLYMSEGVVFSDDGNVDAFMVYTCAQK